MFKLLSISSLLLVVAMNEIMALSWFNVHEPNEELLQKANLELSDSYYLYITKSDDLNNILDELEEAFKDLNIDDLRKWYLTQIQAIGYVIKMPLIKGHEHRYDSILQRYGIPSLNNISTTETTEMLPQVTPPTEEEEEAPQLDRKDYLESSESTVAPVTESTEPPSDTLSSGNLRKAEVSAQNNEQDAQTEDDLIDPSRKANIPGERWATLGYPTFTEEPKSTLVNPEEDMQTGGHLNPQSFEESESLAKEPEISDESQFHISSSSSSESHAIPDEVHDPEEELKQKKPEIEEEKLISGEVEKAPQDENGNEEEKRIRVFEDDDIEDSSGQFNTTPASNSEDVGIPIFLQDDLLESLTPSSSSSRHIKLPTWFKNNKAYNAPRYSVLDMFHMFPNLADLMGYMDTSDCNIRAEMTTATAIQPQMWVNALRTVEKELFDIRSIEQMSASNEKRRSMISVPKARQVFPAMDRHGRKLYLGDDAAEEPQANISSEFKYEPSSSAE